MRKNGVITLVWLDRYVYAGDFTALHYQQSERILSDFVSGALHCVPVSPKMPKFSRKSSLEAYWAQSELLAAAVHWPDSVKALQLALSLMEDAFACLLFLSPEEKGDYTLVGSLQRHFGESNPKDFLRCEFRHCVRQPGESILVLSYEIERLSRRAYADMPPAN